MTRKVLSLFLLCLSLSLAFGAGRIPKSILATRTDVPPVIDGIVADSVWLTASPALDFTQYDPNEGAHPTEQTSVRILYDNEAIYVGVICYDAHPREIVRQLTRRDRESEADRFTVMIDSHYDRQTAYVFSTNVSGVQTDGILSQNGAAYDVTWDAVWKVRTKVFRDGWSAEFEIPYNALRFVERQEGRYRWGINFRRYISRKKEVDEWVMVPRNEALQISQWGTVEGIRGIKPPLHLEFMPYVSGLTSAKTATATDPRTSNTKGEIGLDVKYGIARNFTIDATINPDFGQVEVDQSVLNLTVFETRFPEKRPFFVEGAQIFSFGTSADNTPLSLYFSRRVGRRPGGSSMVQVPPGGTITDNPQVTRILGAAKITGRTEGGFSLGAFSALTDDMEATVEDASGAKRKIRTEPRGSYNVFRFTQEFSGASWIGGMATLASRNQLNPAVTAGVDWNVRIGEGDYTVDGYFAVARASTERTMLDGGTGRDGLASRLLVGRIAADHWLYFGSFSLSTPYFNPNDMGFFAQPHDYGGYGQLIYRENFGSGFFRRYTFSVVPEARWSWGNVMTFTQTELTATAELPEFWTATVIYDFIPRAYDDEERGIAGIHLRPLGHAVTAILGTDVRRSVSAQITGGFGFDERGKKKWVAALDLTMRPVSTFELKPAVTWIRARDEETWVYPYGGVVSDPSITVNPFAVYGDRDLDELDMSLRGTVTFTRDLSLQAYTQVLLARGRYQNYRRNTGRSSISYNYPANPGFVSGDFNEAIFNANVLLRWEYLPGSTIYLVWTQGRFGDTGDYLTGFSRRFEDTFRLPHEDAILLKLSYWIPL
jgi:hypothetical protein